MKTLRLLLLLLLGSAAAMAQNPNINSTTPAAPSGGTNCVWQSSSTSASCYIPTGTYDAANAAAAALTSAETFSANASNISSGTLSAARMAGGGVIYVNATPCTVGAASPGCTIATSSGTTIVVAAANSLPVGSSGAQYVATGTNDQTTIQAAINACPSTTPASAGPAGCVVVLQPGIYNTSATVTIDTDDVTLTGEGQCMWGGYNAVWTSTTSPNGAIGTGCAQLRASATGFPLITIAHANSAGTGVDTARHRGIKISQLYLVGDSYLNQGIITTGSSNSGTYGGVTVTGNSDDNVEISHMVIQRTNLGIAGFFDTPNIFGNSIQDNNGPAEMICGGNARVHDELLFDDAGTLMVGCSTSASYTGNILGDTKGDGIHFYMGGAHAVSNTVMGVVGSAFYVDGVAGTALTGNVINYTSTGSLYNTNGTLPTSSDAIHITSGSSGVIISGNLIESGVNETGYAVDDLGSTDTIGQNAITGTWRYGLTGGSCYSSSSACPVTVTGVPVAGAVLTASGPTTAFWSYSGATVPSLGTNCRNSSSSGASMACTLTTTAGDTLLIFTETGVAVSAITDVGTATTTPTSVGTYGPYGFAYSDVNVGAGSHTVTVTYASSTSNPNLQIVDIAGALTTSPVDGTPVSNYESTASTAVTSGALTTTGANELLVAHTWFGGTGTWTAGSPAFTILAGPGSDIAATLLASTPGSYTFNATASAAFPNATILLAIK